MGKISDLSGHKFGRLLVLSREYVGNRNPKWKCICDCGAIHVTTGSSLRSGDGKSCGCLRKDLMTKHNMCGTLTYTSWTGLVSRVLGEYKDPVNFKYYEGLEICESWIGEQGFVNFYSDMGERGHANLSIDRIDPNKGYSKDNCRWADKTTQARNTNSDGMNGINWSKPKKKWVVSIGVGGKNIYLGITSDIEAAKKIRKEAEETYWNDN